MWEHGAGAAAAAALLPGENFYNFVKMFPSDAGGWGGGEGWGCTPGEGAGEGDTQM